MRLLSLLLFAALAGITFAAEDPAAPAAPSPSEPAVIEGHVRREPVLPLNLPDFELQSLDVKKEVVFHVGNQTVIGRVPIFVYVPLNRNGRANAMDRLIEARSILVTAAASSRVTTADLAAIRDLIERAVSDLRSDAAPKVPEASSAN